MSPASSWALLGIVLVALPVCVVMLLAILADLGSPVVACEDREWGALLDAVDAAREDFPDHFPCHADVLLELANGGAA